MILNKNKRYLLIFLLVIGSAHGAESGSEQGSWWSNFKGWFTGKTTQEQSTIKSNANIKNLALKAAAIGASTYATSAINSYFGTVPGYILHGTVQFSLLVVIQMYEAWQKGDLTSLQELKNILPTDVLTKSYWQKNKLLTLLQYSCSAASCVAPYLGISPAYPIGASLFVQTLLYDDAVKESLSANLYDIASKTSVQSMPLIIANLPEAVQAAFSSLSPSQVPAAAEGLLNLLNASALNQTALAQ